MPRTERHLGSGQRRRRREHTDLAAHLQADGWDTATFVRADLFDKDGLALLAAEVQASAPASIGFVRATRR